MTRTKRTDIFKKSEDFFNQYGDIIKNAKAAVEFAGNEVSAECGGYVPNDILRESGNIRSESRNIRSSTGYDQNYSEMHLKIQDVLKAALEALDPNPRHARQIFSEYRVLNEYITSEGPKYHPHSAVSPPLIAYNVHGVPQRGAFREPSLALYDPKYLEGLGRIVAKEQIRVSEKEVLSPAEERFIVDAEDFKALIEVLKSPKIAKLASDIVEYREQLRDYKQVHEDNTCKKAIETVENRSKARLEEARARSEERLSGVRGDIKRK